ncbi:hypothetical protein EXIGLDRAFT_248643 [Exidia glandulosa HHB12029]|uniref:Uncharacterized protein n=1 Tax=Exidia glandulosa HHB12029 TaxID=1314781 RepID=A0A165MFW7_EXIGL|nr:hypothetical protein EXIGLDRAFT_248643 [Exidia glandulosa HHB12029]
MALVSLQSLPCCSQFCPSRDVIASGNTQNRETASDPPRLSTTRVHAPAQLMSQPDDRSQSCINHKAAVKFHVSPGLPRSFRCCCPTIEYCVGRSCLFAPGASRTNCSASQTPEPHCAKSVSRSPAVARGAGLNYGVAVDAVDLSVTTSAAVRSEAEKTVRTTERVACAPCTPCDRHTGSLTRHE